VPVNPDSIVALSTPPGRSGIGVIRISGPDSLSILRSLINDQAYEPKPNRLTLRSLVDPFTSETIDQALVCFFKSPHSFTGEDLVELHCHGSPVLLQTVIALALKLEARLADPGEFSLRAVRNGRMPLSEAEAIRDLINAQTDAAARQATRQLKGELSQKLQPAKSDLLNAIVRLESSLEFVEDDLPEIEHDKLLTSLHQLLNSLTELAETFSRGRLLRDGLMVTLVGRPNVGKSSLFNALLGRPRAIVTAVPGTTRDTISEPLGLNGVPVWLIDTAGIRATQDEIETIGVSRSKGAAADADLLIVVIDGSDPLHSEDRDVLGEIKGQPHIVALNKSDLGTLDSLRQELSDDDGDASVIPVSAKIGAGLEDLRAAILKPFDQGTMDGQDLLITNARHHDLLMKAVAAINDSATLLNDRSSEELILVGLHNALSYLGQITGETTTDEILGQIFSTFCIGK
jgi:tRNA modification GTPase